MSIHSVCVHAFCSVWLVNPKKMEKRGGRVIDTKVKILTITAQYSIRLFWLFDVVSVAL